MSLDIEKQSLPTLKEWARLLGFRGISTFRKPQLIELLNKAGEERISYVLKQQSGKDEAAEKPEAAKEALSSAENSAEAQTIPEPQSEPETKTAEEDNSEISGVADDEKQDHRGRRRYTNMTFNERNRNLTGRSGFGTYAPSYRAQQEEKPRGQAPQDIPRDGGFDKDNFGRNFSFAREGYARTSRPQNDREGMPRSFDRMSPERTDRGYDRASQERGYDRMSPDRTDRGFDRTPADRGYDRTPAERADRGYDRASQERSYDRMPAERADRGYDRTPADRGFDRMSRERSGERPSFDRMGSDRPAFDRAADRMPAERPPFERLTPDKMIGERPIFERTNFDRPPFERTATTEEYRDPESAEKTAEAVPPVFGKDEIDPRLIDAPAHGILEVMPDGYGFIRCENYLPGENDVYVAAAQIRRFGLKTGDVLTGMTKVRTGTEKFAALLMITKINDETPEAAMSRKTFEDLTPVFPNERIQLETVAEERAMRLMNVLAPIGKGQRGMIVSPPKAGKTTLLKAVAKAVTANHADMHLIILLIDERPEEVTDIKESIEGPNVEVIYSTFDETPEHHKRVAEMVLGRAQRLVEHGRDVMILLDSITRLARAYNLTVAPSGRTLSGGLDPAALHMPKKFFGAARNMREGGSLTILATALVDTGSRLDDMVFEEFKGTGNMELVLDRKLSERRIFPAIDLLKSGTRRDDLLLTEEEQETAAMIRQAISNTVKGEESLEKILDLMRHTKTNREFCALVRKIRF